MKFAELVVLLPCHSLEDFPVHYEGDEAEGLLAAWGCLWHPALLACVERLPVWYRADAPPEDLAGRLLVIPSASESMLAAGWTNRASDEGALVLRKLIDRAALVRAALESLDGGDAGVPAELAADFLALGTTYLLVELLTRQMRYMSNIDEVQLQNQAVAAAQAAVAQRHDEARDLLRSCFEILLESRERFYPVDAYLVDLTLVAPTTLGEPLRRALGGNLPANYWLTGACLEQLAAQEPATFDALRAAVERGTACVVGGEFNEPPLPLLPAEGVLTSLRHGIAVYEQHLGKPPAVYARRRFGLSPLLPGVLSQLGFEGALHATLDDGRFPTPHQAKTRWEGFDASAIDVVGRVPADASLPQTMLDLPRRMGESMDMDHVATVVLAHWPGQTTPYYDDLRRASEFVPVLGRWVTLNGYFRDTDSPGELTRFKPDEYRAPYLRQAIVRQQADPLSSFVSTRREAAEQLTAELLETCVATLTRQPVHAAAEPTSHLQRGRAALEHLAPLLARGGKSQELAVLAINPASVTRRIAVDVSALSTLPEVAAPVIAAQESAAGKQAVVEVPALGFAWITAGAASSRSAPRRRQKPMAEGNELRNDRFTVVIDETTGGVRSVYLPNQRGNRVTQQIAFRLPAPKPAPGDIWRDPDEDAPYTVMACDGLEIVAAGPAVAAIRSRGRLLDREGRRLAGFVQTTEVAIGSPVVRLAIELDLEELPRADAWNSYYALRLAWSDEFAEVYRSVHGTRHETTLRRFESPDWVDVVSGAHRLTLLCGGLPYHRRSGARMLDTLLVARGESARRFEVGLGIDLAAPQHEAWALSAGAVPTLAAALDPGQARSGWLFHIDARNVLATCWQPLEEPGRVVGFRLRLLETEGKSGRVHVRGLYRLATARQVDFHGRSLVQLTVEEDRLVVNMAAYEWAELEARFA